MTNEMSSESNGLLHFVPVDPTKEDLEWADLRTLDLSTYEEGPEARENLAKIVHDAMTTDGFFALTNFGITAEEIERQVDIGYTVFEQTSPEEKQRLRAQLQEKGCYRGFKLRRYWEFENNVQDRIEHFNWFRDTKVQEFPSVMQPFMEEVTSFSERVHKDILFKIYRLFAIALQLDPETFVEKHRFELNDEAWFRYMAYYDEFTEEEEAKISGVWLKGHQDFNTLTVLFSQPMAALQVRDEAGNWRYVKHIPGGIIVSAAIGEPLSDVQINCGAFMSWYTGGYFKAAQHRVHGPPKDQRGRTRLGVFYFSVPNDDEKPNTLMNSPVLQKAGVKPIFESEEKTITSKQYCQARIGSIGKTQGWKQSAAGGDVTVEIICGVEIPTYY